MEYELAHMLLAKMRVPDDYPYVIYRRADWSGWPPDPSFISLPRGGEFITAMAIWEPYDVEILQAGQVGSVLIVPLWPGFWQHLKAGQTLNWLYAPFSAQILEPLEKEASA